MKKVLASVFVLGLVVLNVCAFAQVGEIGDLNQVTCYSTYSGTGTTTITKCNGCIEVSNIQSMSDSGKCRP